MQELAHHWHDDADALPIIKDRVQNDEDTGVRRAALQVLVCGWRGDPDTLPIIRDRAQHDQNGGVRHAAEAILRHWGVSLDG